MFGFCFISRKDGHCFLEAALGSRRGEWERFISFCQSSIIQLEYLKSIRFLQSFQGTCLNKKKERERDILKKLSVLSTTQLCSGETGRSRVSLVLQGDGSLMRKQSGGAGLGRGEPGWG